MNQPHTHTMIIEEDKDEDKSEPFKFGDLEFTLVENNIDNSNNDGIPHTL